MIHICEGRPKFNRGRKKNFNNQKTFSRFSRRLQFKFAFFRRAAEEHLAELMPIFEQLRAQGDLPCTYPLHVSSFGTAFIRGGSRSTPLSPHAPHCHPASHWVSFVSTFKHHHHQAVARPMESPLSVYKSCRKVHGKKRVKNSQCDPS